MTIAGKIILAILLSLIAVCGIAVISIGIMAISYCRHGGEILIEVNVKDAPKDESD